MNARSTRLKIKEFLRERQWTTKVLSEKTGMSESYLTHIKNGTRRWNEDALDKISQAFEINFNQLLENHGYAAAAIYDPAHVASANQKVKMIPVVGEIPSNPNEYTNKLTQITTGFKDQAIPVANINDNAMFALCTKLGDYFIISPSSYVKSGDYVAVQFGKDEPIKMIAKITYTKDKATLESIDKSKAPIVLSLKEENFKIVGKVICRHQHMI